eukprot:Polyplicarium_translucidae@DN3309_c0_g2_i5.p1
MIRCPRSVRACDVIRCPYGSSRGRVFPRYRGSREFDGDRRPASSGLRSQCRRFVECSLSNGHRHIDALRTTDGILSTTHEYVVPIVSQWCPNGVEILSQWCPANADFISRLIRRLQREQLTVKDERIKVTNEVLSGIKVGIGTRHWDTGPPQIIKLYAWEDSFIAKILGIRAREMKIFWKYQLSQACALGHVHLLPPVGLVTSPMGHGPRYRDAVDFRTLCASRERAHGCGSVHFIVTFPDPQMADAVFPFNTECHV